jgi:hypothetical protein
VALVDAQHVYCVVADAPSSHLTATVYYRARPLVDSAAAFRHSLRHANRYLHASVQYYTAGNPASIRGHPSGAVLFICMRLVHGHCQTWRLAHSKRCVALLLLLLVVVLVLLLYIQVSVDLKLGLPQVAVVGSQSSGKSSVLEALVREGRGGGGGGAMIFCCMQQGTGWRMGVGVGGVDAVRTSWHAQLAQRRQQQRCEGTGERQGGGAREGTGERAGMGGETPVKGRGGTGERQVRGARGGGGLVRGGAGVRGGGGHPGLVQSVGLVVWGGW